MPTLLVLLILAGPAAAFEARPIVNVSPYLVWSWGKVSPVAGKSDQVRWDLYPKEYRCGFVFEGGVKEGAMAGPGVLRFHEDGPCKGRRIEGELSELSDPIPDEAYHNLAREVPKEPQTATGYRAKGALYEAERKTFEGVIENGEYVGDGVYVAPDGAVVIGPVQGWVFMPPVFEGTVSVKYADGRKETRFLETPRLALSVAYGLLDETKENPMAISSAALAQWQLGDTARAELEKKPGMFSKKKPEILYPPKPQAGSCGLAAPYGTVDPVFKRARWVYEGECKDGLAEGWGRMWKTDSWSSDFLFGRFRGGAPRGRGVTNTGLDCVWEDFESKTGYDCSRPVEMTWETSIPKGPGVSEKVKDGMKFLNYWGASIFNNRVYGGRPIVYKKNHIGKELGVIGGFWMPLGGDYNYNPKVWEGMVPAGHVTSFDANGMSQGPIWVLWQRGDDVQFWDYEHVRTTWDPAFRKEMDFRSFARDVRSLVATKKAWVAMKYFGSQAVVDRYGWHPEFRSLEAEASRGRIAEEKWEQEVRRNRQAEDAARARSEDKGLFGSAVRQASDAYFQGEMQNLDRMRATRSQRYRTYTGSENTQEGARRRDEALDRYFGR